MKHTIALNSTLEIPELRMHFNFRAIAPEGSKYGAWPYCLSYQVPGLDAFGIGDYGSNIRIEDPSNVDGVLNEFIAKNKADAIKTLETAKLGSREYQVGHKYKVIFTSIGLSHSGTYFESFRDIETYLKRLNEGKSQRFGAEVFSASGREFLGEYLNVCGNLIYQKKVK